MTEDYVSFKTAKLLKEKGFAEPCNAYWFHMIGTEPIFNDNMPREVYDNKSDTIEIIGCPTLQMAMKWMREVHDVHINTMYNDIYARPYEFRIIKQHGASKSDAHRYITYEECVEKAIKFCLENLV